MWEKFKNAVLGMVTEHDNKTHSLLKHGGWAGFVSVLGLAVYHEYQGLHVDVKEFAISLSIILGSVGLGVGASKSAEHNDESEKGGA